ncbi:hypothetical protein B1757_12790 [Acidithiobacillus marinus]|uniref:Uncharacterized protein n=1 Tax=Acidithiobacillus marinus TaxID=187490 RepID=A0A2I1DIW9_9PROT|nr:hypothetical protein [Acidithiobacillus marinus]PKY09820.1 hypothetical protein B1757_12790 [Acidithiobacillus marinus]
MNDLGTFVGNCILIVMGIAVLFGNTEDLGYAAIFGIVAIIASITYKLVTDEEFRHRFTKH